MIAIAVSADQFGAIRRLAARGQAPPSRSSLGEALAAGAKCLFQNDAVLRLCRATVGGGPLLQSPDQVIIDVAHQQLSHPRCSLPFAKNMAISLLSCKHGGMEVSWTLTAPTTKAGRSFRPDSNHERHWQRDRYPLSRIRGERGGDARADR